MSSQTGLYYMSSLDLNIEQGKIEEPLRPTIRLSKKLITDDGLEGMTIINYSANQLLDMILKYEDSSHSKNIFLLNSDGYFLTATDQNYLPWGFMYEELSEETFYNILKKHGHI